MSNDWIEHNGGPQPVGDDVWVHFEFELDDDEPMPGPATWFDWHGPCRYRILNQHLIDAARLEGIRLGLEAAVKEVGAGRWRWTTREENLTWVQWSIRLKDVYKHCEILIRNLNPDTIAKEAQHD